MSVEIRFYHLLRQNVEQALPGLVDKAMQTGKKILIKTPDQATTDRLDECLWSYDPASFLPHEVADSSQSSLCPVVISDKDQAVGEIEILILVGGARCDQLEEFDLCCQIFDGRDDASVKQARQDWKLFKDQEFDLTYWQQTEKGWAKAA